MRFRTSAVAALLLVATLACDDVLTGGSSRTKQVSLAGTSFTPDSVDISAGDTVFWIWAEGTHDVRSFATGQVWGGCGLKASGICFVVFPTAGSFSYYCNPHVGFGMTGVVVVH